jgi:hypothetical protein
MVCLVPIAVTCGFTDTVIPDVAGGGDEALGDEDPPPHPSAKNIKDNGNNPR